MLARRSPSLRGLSRRRRTALCLVPGRVDGAAAPRAWEEPRRGGAAGRGWGGASGGRSQGPERTRLARLCKTHMVWTARFLVAPTALGVADSYGMELSHPMREGRSPAQIGMKGKSNHWWIVGGELCFILNQ